MFSRSVDNIPIQYTTNEPLKNINKVKRGLPTALHLHIPPLSARSFIFDRNNVYLDD